MAAKKDVKAASLKGVRNGDATSVAIMLPPGSRSINGAAMNS